MPRSPGKYRTQSKNCSSTIKQSVPKMFVALVVILLAVLVILNVLLVMRVQSQAGLESRLRDDIVRLQQVQSGDSRALRQEIESRMELIRGVVDQRLHSLQTDNA